MSDLYQEIIMGHFRHPRHYGPVSEDEAMADEENPTCGDHFRLTVDLDGDVIRDIRFDGKGCAISTSSCSLMTERVLGKTRSEAIEMAGAFERALKGTEPLDEAKWGEVAALDSVRKFPLRVKCAVLGWNALRKALKGTGGEAG